MNIKQIQQRHKICPYCEVGFCDVTEKKSMIHCCQEHAMKTMVKKRKENGSYKRTKNQIDKGIETQRKNILKTGGLSQVGRQKKSEQFKKLWESDEYREKRKINSIKKCGVAHWTQTEEGRKKVSGWKLGKKQSKKACESVSKSWLNKIKEPNSFTSKFANGGYRDDIQMYVRSNWEANIIRILKLLNIKFEYEKHHFKIIDENDDNKEKFYIPDLKINDKTFVEIKGIMFDKYKRKMELFRKQYPDVKLIVIGGDIYSRMRKKWKDKVLWE